MTFTADDFSEIAQTFLFYGNEVQAAIKHMQVKRFAAQQAESTGG